MLVDIGCYTLPDGATGITTLRLDGTAFTEVSVTPMDSPSWLCAHPSLPVVYAVNETGDGAVTVCRRQESGALDTVQSALTGGSFPCHLAISQGFLLAANYGNGSVSVFALDRNGEIAARTDVVEHRGSGPDGERQEGPHVHMVAPGRDGTVRAVDLGTDRVVTYRLDEGGRLEQVGELRLPGGFGPRQLVDLPDGRTVVVGELASRLALVDGDEVVATVSATNQPVLQGNLPAQLTVHGGRLFVSNRGNDCITTVDLDGSLRTVADRPVGRAPRHFAFVGERVLVAAQDENAVELYGDDIVARVLQPSPTFVLVSQDGIASPQDESVH